MMAEDPHPRIGDIRLHALNGIKKKKAALEIEWHVLDCSRCAGILEQIQVQHRQIRSSLRNNGLSVHLTKAGRVSVWLLNPPGQWMVRVIGAQADLCETARDRTVALQKALALFAGAFPDHECSGCGAGRMRG